MTKITTYYPTSTAPIDVLSAPYVQDSKFASYSESPLLNGNTMMYLNPAAPAGSLSEISSGSSISVQNALEIPMMASRNEVMFIPPNGGPLSVQTINEQLNAAATNTVEFSVPGDLPLTSRSQLGTMYGARNLQGLSLSLGTQMSTVMPDSQLQCPYANPGFTSLLNSHIPFPAENGCEPLTTKVGESSHSNDFRSAGYVPYDVHGEGENYIRFGTVNTQQYPTNPQIVNLNSYSYEQAGISNTILKSKYLKPAQQLLDEVVNVGVALTQPDSAKDQKKINNTEEGSKDFRGKSFPTSDADELTTGSSHELSAAERQELQNKMDKFLTMLDEVDQRYRQYYHQMQILASSFDMVAGLGAAKPYSSLALKTISRHFRSLRDAISNQIKVTRKSLGEQDTPTGQGGSIPRLRCIDQQLRQQQALQQFGMMRNAWRPQRGLPESAVSILRAWLFEHFLHPYPKDSEKIMLARQTGLTRGQVANWFINARVRLWKPMVEEMYKEEFGDGDMNFKASPEDTPKMTGTKSWASEDKREDLQESEASLASDDLQPGQRHETRANINHDGVFSRSFQRGLEFSSRVDDAKNYGLMRLPDDHKGEVSFISGPSYQVPELGGFMVENQVSLALGLRNETTGTTVDASTDEYMYLDPVNPQNRYGNLHISNDFVA